MSINLYRIGTPARWEKMLISKGNLKPPTILYAKPLPDRILVGVKETENKGNTYRRREGLGTPANGGIAPKKEVKMGICEACPFGIIRGSIGNLTFSYQKGRLIVRKKQKKGLRKTEILRKEGMSIKYIRRFNNNFIFSLLTHIAKELSRNLIFPAWWRVVKKKRLKMSPRNLFVKHNLSLLYDSLSKDKLCGANNKPDLTKLVLTVGDLEPARIKNLQYEENELKVEWEPTPWANPEDYAYIMEIRADFDDFDSWDKIWIWGDARRPVGRRGDGGAAIKLNPNEGIQIANKGEVYVYLFFSSSKVDSRFPRVPEYSVSESFRLSVK